MMRSPMALVVLLLLGSAATLQVACTSAKTFDLLATDQAFDAATAAHGLEGFAQFLADDVATLRPDQPIIQGKAAVMRVWAPLLENRTLAIRWKPLASANSGAGDLGYTMGSYEISRIEGPGKRIVDAGKYVTIWRKQRDGSWKVVFDSGVPDSPPAAVPRTSAS